jgi:hypothetical protein
MLIADVGGRHTRTIKQNNLYISGTSVGNDIILINKFVTEFE